MSNKKKKILGFQPGEDIWLWNDGISTSQEFKKAPTPTVSVHPLGNKKFIVTALYPGTIVNKG